jgi:hypothetical protein
MSSGSHISEKTVPKAMLDPEMKAVTPAMCTATPEKSAMGLKLAGDLLNAPKMRSGHSQSVWGC